MKEYPVCHTTVRGGAFGEDCVARLEKQIESHNFVNRVDVLVDAIDLDMVTTAIQNLTYESLILEATLSQIIKFIVSLDMPTRSSLKLVMLDKDITHENTICISSGILTLKLRSDTYLKSGFQFKKSAFSYGNKNLHTQMYVHDFDICKLEENIKQQSKNDIRLLWFTENIDTHPYKFIITHNASLEIIKPSILESGITISKRISAKPEITKLNDCISPDLSIVQDEDVLAETLEWITYASIRGQNLNTKVDPFISRYLSMMDVASKCNLGVITIDKCLLSSISKSSVFKILSESTKWFAVSYYGVKDVTRTYTKSGEHSFVDDGSNNIVIFINDGKYAAWSITDSGDPN